MTMTRISLCLLMAAAAVFLAPDARAANRTVCFDVVLLVDGRFNCPASSATPGALDNCHSSTDYVIAERAELKLWDKDPTGGDEYIGSFVYNVGGGVQCISFPWEGQTYAGGEPHPDVYLTFTNRMVSLPDFMRIIRIVQPDGTIYPESSWRDGEPGDPERYVAWNIEPGESPTIPSAGALVPNPSVATDYGAAVIALRSASLTLGAFGTSFDSGAIVDMEYPTDIGGSCATTSCSLSRSLIVLASGHSSDAIRVGADPILT